jgi:hypothetical protein
MGIRVSYHRIPLCGAGNGKWDEKDWKTKSHRLISSEERMKYIHPKKMRLLRKNILFSRRGRSIQPRRCTYSLPCGKG